jgi:hypothetical protein
MIGERRYIVKNQIIVLSVEFPGIVGASATPRRAVVIRQFPERGIVIGLRLRARAHKCKQHNP